MSGKYQMYSRAGTPNRVDSQNGGATEIRVTNDRIVMRFLPLRKSCASSGATIFFSSRLMTWAKAARISKIPERSRVKRVDAYAPIADASAGLNKVLASSTLFNKYGISATSRRRATLRKVTAFNSPGRTDM